MPQAVARVDPRPSSAAADAGIVGAVDGVPPHLYFVVSAVFHYLGPAFAVLLFARVDVLGVAWLRIASAAVIFAVWRRPWRAFMRLDPDGRRLLLGLGAVLAGMNVCFYVSIDRLPLGTVAAIEFLPVVALAALGARTSRNAVALLVAVPGVYLLTGVQLGGEPLGVAFAFANAVLFALYIVLAHRVSRHDCVTGIDGLAASMLIAAVVVTPIGGWQVLPAMGDPVALLAGIGVGVSSSVIPYVSDQLAMQRLERATYALMVSLLPATATVIGVLVLAQVPSFVELIGVTLVVVGVGLHREPDLPSPMNRSDVRRDRPHPHRGVHHLCARGPPGVYAPDWLGTSEFVRPSRPAPRRSTRTEGSSAIAAHVRIRLLLALAVVVICSGVFAVTEVQRRSDEASFVEYASVRELRDATMQMALAFDEANAYGAKASEDVEAAERTLALAMAAVRLRPDAAEPAEARLVKEQAARATGVAELADEAAKGGGAGELKPQRDAMLERFIVVNDKLLEELAGERAVARADAARRPVVLVVILFVVFGLLHLLLVERPASRDRRARRAQGEFADAMQVARSESEAYDMIARHVERVSEARHVTVLNRNNSSDRLEPVTPVEPGSTTAQGLDGAAPDSCLAVRLARSHHGEPGEERLLTCEVCGNSAEETTCVPTLVGGEVIGAVLVEHGRWRGNSRRAAIEHSVAEAAPVVANLRNLAVAELRAATDALTGLANQRSVHETLKRAAAQAGRTASSLGLVLFDLDHFKAINDCYGHGKGDEVLAAVGAVAAGAVRASDFLGRLGGEEFAAVLPNTNLAGATEAAEKIRAALATIQVPGVERIVTASFGVAVMPDDAGEPDRLLRVADRALYAAKSAGRDQVKTSQSALVPPEPAPAV